MENESSVPVSNEKEAISLSSLISNQLEKIAEQNSLTLNEVIEVLIHEALEKRRSVVIYDSALSRERGYFRERFI